MQMTEAWAIEQLWLFHAAWLHSGHKFWTVYEAMFIWYQEALMELWTST